MSRPMNFKEFASLMNLIQMHNNPISPRHQGYKAVKYVDPYVAQLTVEALGLSYVPVLKEEVKLSEFGDVENDPRGVVENILKYAEGPGMNTGVKREGVVFKSLGSNFSFKAISNSYLLKKG